MTVTNRLENVKREMFKELFSKLYTFYDLNLTSSVMIKFAKLIISTKKIIHD